MKTAKVALAADIPAGAGLLDSAQDQLNILRGTIDTRLADLESALADQSRMAALPGLILELSRLATAEAQAAATRAVRQVQNDTAAAVADAEARSSAALEVERRTTQELRKAIARLEARLGELERE